MDYTRIDVNLYPGPGCHRYRVSVYSDPPSLGDWRNVVLCGGQTVTVEMSLW